MPKAPTRIRLSRAKGWRMPANTVKVDRTTRWGNPFRVGTPGIPDAETALARYRAAVAAGELPKDDVAELAGKNLACWCAIGAPCHADVLLELANPAPAARTR